MRLLLLALSFMAWPDLRVRMKVPLLAMLLH
jgi:hypothetical protein